MRNLDIRELALHVDEYIRRLHRGGFGPAPILIADGDEPLAVVIRHQVYAPRLQDFVPTDRGYVCWECTGRPVVASRNDRLDHVMNAVNRHYRDIHQGAT